MRRTAFTIVELLIVISIIGLLTALAASSYINAQKGARDTARKSDVGSIATAVESYFRATGTYPGNTGTESGPPIPAQESASTWQGCMLSAGAGGYENGQITYYYSPGIVCGNRQAAQDFDPTQYQPEYSWIPNLGAYINPMPIETHYESPSGDNSAFDAATPWGATTDILQGSPGYSLFYAHLIGGYMVYTNLENTDSSAVPQGTIFGSATDPKLADSTAVTVNASNIFMIIK